MRYSVIGATVQQVKELGGTEIKETRRTGIIFAALNIAAVRRLEGLGFVVCEVKKVSTTWSTPTVVPPTPVEAEPIYTPSDLASAAGFDQLRLLTDPPLFGKGINVAVIDTGIRETHADVMSRVVYNKNYTTDPMEDGFDHGTGVTSIILAVAPLCGILNMKVLNNNGEGTEEEVVTAIDDCMDLLDTDPEIAPSVINLSLGSVDDGNPNNIVRVACRAAVEQGIWILAACGNEGPTAQTITTPASERLVLAVGSLSLQPFTLSSFSSRGPTLEGLVKPDAVERGLTGAIVSRLEKQGLKILALKMLHMDKSLAGRHYGIHRDKPFFTGLVNYITSGPIVALVFEGEGAVEKIRRIMGATDPAKAEKGTIRADFGLDVQQNSTHASDAVETAEEEIKLFFAEDEIFDY